MIAAGAVAIDAGPAVDVLTGGVDATAAEPPDPAVIAVSLGSSRGKVRTQIVHVSALGSDTLPRQSVESDASRELHCDVGVAGILGNDVERIIAPAPHEVPVCSRRRPRVVLSRAGAAGRQHHRVAAGIWRARPRDGGGRGRPRNQLDF